MPGNLFMMISGHEIRPPVVPECERHADETKMRELVSLSDADELGGEAEYIVDNGLLQAETAGLVYRFSKRTDDWDMDTAPQLWGSTVIGHDNKDGWLKVEDRY